MPYHRPPPRPSPPSRSSVKPLSASAKSPKAAGRAPANAQAAGAQGNATRFERWMALSVLGLVVLVIGGLGWHYLRRGVDSDRLTDAAFHAFQENVKSTLSESPHAHVLIGPAVECVREGVAYEKRRQASSITKDPGDVAQNRLASAKSRCLENFLMRSEMYLATDRDRRTEMRQAILQALGS